MSFGYLEAFNPINIVPCGQGKAKFLNKNQEHGAECENFGPLPIKMPIDQTGNFFIPINIVTLTYVDFFKESASNISSNVSEIHT